jgi:hypothetical protein
MIYMTEVFERINGAFPLFSYGERYAEEFLDRYSFDREGVRQRWEVFDRLWRNVQEFLRTEFPGLREIDRMSLCELQMYLLRDKIERIEREYECYRSIIEQHPRPLAGV